MHACDQYDVSLHVGTLRDMYSVNPLLSTFSEFVIAWCMAMEAEANSQTVSTQWIGGKAKHGGVARRTFSTQWIGVRPCMEVWQGGQSVPNVNAWCMQHLYVMTNDSKLVYAIW